MSDLMSWLEEQITEEERPTYELVPFPCEPDCCAPADWVGHRCLICDETSYGGSVSAMTEIAEAHAERVHQRRRVLAECAAKRKIIRRAVEILRAFEHQPGALWSDVNRRERHHANAILEDLASVFADRPGYQPEWAL